MQYRNNLIGKHFKALSQTMVFHIHDLVPNHLFQLIKVSGFLTGLIWYPKIDDLEEYLVCILSWIINFCYFLAISTATHPRLSHHQLPTRHIHYHVSSQSYALSGQVAVGRRGTYSIITKTATGVTGWETERFKRHRMMSSACATDQQEV